jgi:ParB-like chromosome segregation protein Spo0J
MSGDHMRHGPHDLQSHPIGDTFPKMGDTEFAELVADIKANGVREPIVLYEGKILDGRHRYKAAQAAGVECPRKEYQGTDPIKYVLSLNLHRRHLHESQRAMVAAKLTNLKDGQRPSQVCEPAVTRERAAEMLNVSPRSIDSARVVLDHGSVELQDKVDAREVSVSAAADVARLPKDEQREIVAKGSGEIKKAAKREREKRAGEKVSTKARSPQQLDTVDAVAEPEPQPEPKRKRRSTEEIAKELAKKDEPQDREHRSRDRNALEEFLECYDQPLDKVAEAAKWFEIDERGCCEDASRRVVGIRRAAAFLLALADILEGRGLSKEPVYDDVDAVDDDGSKSKAKSS